MMNIDKNYVFGDIIAAEIPFTDGLSSKIRPVLILRKDKDDYLVVRISSVTQSREHLDVELSANMQNNLKIFSLIKIGKIGLFSKYIFRKKIGNISDVQKSQVKQNMKQLIEEL